MEFFAKSTGKKVVIGLASFEDALALQNVIAKSASSTGLKLDFDMSKSFAEQDLDISSIINSALGLIGSESIQAALMKCLGKSLYNGERITPALFDNDPEARGAFYEIALACLKVNIGPLAQSLFSVFSATKAGMVVQAQNSPKSE